MLKIVIGYDLLSEFGGYELISTTVLGMCTTLRILWPITFKIILSTCAYNTLARSIPGFGSDTKNVRYEN